MLPDDDGRETEVDLLAHYWLYNRYVWLALTAMNILLIVPLLPNSGDASFAELFSLARSWLFYIGLTLSLILFQNSWWRRILVPVMLGIIVTLWGGQTLTGTL